ncbi:heme-binding protein [Robbsia sp. Bb-Pol-6]|uniref:Heme-binding protein n=1 Tax=Robbsia betulipollinis TaxID=2981849 RepID=A0ABT3ZHR7_9BURK|nr:heme-binding protein [Robbsia betulipollinis]MCY0386066.1 heme-binding protein [Robbsia betulipollinis]
MTSLFLRTRLVSCALAASLGATLLAPAPARAASPMQPGELPDAAATAAIDAAEKTALSLNARVCIAVVDSAGTLKAFRRMEGAAPGCVDSAINKARAAAVYRTPTLSFMERVNHGEPALTTLPGMVPLGGGVPAKAGATWLGAVGAAGTLNPNEVKIATAGADTLSQAGQ